MVRLCRTYVHYRDGTLALITSIDRFDCGRGVKFNTFASIRIKGAMLDGLRKRDNVPRAVRKSMRKINEARGALADELGCEPTDGEIAMNISRSENSLRRIGMTMAQYYDAVQKENMFKTVSLDGQAGCGLTEIADINADVEKQYEETK